MFLFYYDSAVFDINQFIANYCANIEIIHSRFIFVMHITKK